MEEVEEKERDEVSAPDFDGCARLVRAVERQQQRNLYEHVLVAHGPQFVPSATMARIPAGRVSGVDLFKKLNRLFQGSDPTISDPTEYPPSASIYRW